VPSSPKKPKVHEPVVYIKASDEALGQMFSIQSLVSTGGSATPFHPISPSKLGKHQNYDSLQEKKKYYSVLYALSNAEEQATPNEEGAQQAKR
jgi:hypothetical protein